MYSYDWSWSELWINLFLKKERVLNWTGRKKQVSSKGNSMHMSSVKNKGEKSITRPIVHVPPRNLSTHTTLVVTLKTI